VKRTFLTLALGLGACTEKPAPPLSALSPKPLPAAPRAADGGEDRDAAYRVELVPAWGEPLPPAAVTVELVGTRAQVGGEVFDSSAPGGLAALGAKLARKPALLAPDRDTYLAQVAALMTAFEADRRETWLANADRTWAYRLTLKDETEFQAWLDEPKPGKIRIIQREDGLEVQTNVGKLPGIDPNGPTVPLRGGQLDVGALRRGLGRLKSRFDDAADVCWVPSFGTELARVAEAMSGNYRGAGQRLFDQLCLVYPRPRPRDGG
jgi:hypothetical protein